MAPPVTDEAALERFWTKVDRRGPDDCWEWQARLGLNGYGMWTTRVPDGRRVTRYAHRVAYETSSGPVPDGLELDHLCRNRRCANPAHLEIVTHAENSRRAYATHSDTRTECPHGHPLSGDNVYLLRGRRSCQHCRRARERTYNQRQRLAVPITPRPCIGCGSSFIPARRGSQQTYCSRRCNDRAQRSRLRTSRQKV